MRLPAVSDGDDVVGIFHTRLESVVDVDLLGLTAGNRTRTYLDHNQAPYHWATSASRSGRDVACASYPRDVNS